METLDIEYDHILRAIKDPLQPDRLRIIRTEPMINLKTGEQLNKREIFRSAYYYATGIKWDQDRAHNDISRDVLGCLISPHKEWAIKKNG